MGYTHYWTQADDVPKDIWKLIVTDVRRIIANADVQLAYEYDEPKPPQLDDETIRFNGVGDGGHETFIISRIVRKEKRYEGDNPNWAFCKTAYKPYDVVVTAILAYLGSAHPDLFSATSDGDAPDWKKGLELAAKALPQYSIDLPVEMRPTNP